MWKSVSPLYRDRGGAYYGAALARRRRPGYANTPETRWYYVLYVLKFILYNTGAYYLTTPSMWFYPS